MIKDITLRRQKIQQIRNSLKQSSPILRKNHDLVKNRLELQSRGTSDQICGQEQKVHHLADISLFDQKYQLGEKIGQGSDGIVRKCICKKNGKIYAVKAMMMDDEQIYFLRKNFLTIKNLNHPNIIHYKALYLDLCKHICYLVMQYIPYPSLILIDKGSTEGVLRGIFYQLFAVLAYLHSKHICHRDIKPENIICQPESHNIRLIDFGISKQMLTRGQKRQMLTLTGTLYYRAPQMFLGGGYDERIDLWAAGISLYKMVIGVTPFQSLYHSTTISNIIQRQLNLETLKKCSPQLSDLIQKLLRPRQSRISAQQALKHEWFTKEKIQFGNFCTNEELANSPLAKRKHSNDDSEKSPLLYFLNQRKQFDCIYSYTQKDLELDLENCKPIFKKIEIGQFN